MNIRHLKLEVVILVLAGLTAVICYGTYWHSLEGDPSISFSFMKYFWQKPFSFGLPGEVAFGATSPFYVIMGSIFHLFGDALVVFYLTKIVAFVMICASIFFMYKIAQSFGLETPEKNNFLLLFLIVFIYFFNSNLFYDSVYLYETYLVMFYVSCTLYLSKKYDNLYSVAFSSLGYLVRPELIVIQGLTFLLFSCRNLKKKSKKDIIFAFLITATPLLSYHTYMFFQTGLLMPTSVASRFSRHSTMSSFGEHYFLFLQFFPFFLITLPMSITGIYYLYKRKNTLEDLFLFAPPIVFVGLIFVFNGHRNFPMRYFDFSVAIAIPLCACTLYRIIQKTKKSNILMSLLLLSTTVGYFFIKSYHQEYQNWHTTEIVFKKTVLVGGALILIAISFWRSPRQVQIIALALLALSTSFTTFQYGWYNKKSEVFNRLDKDFGDKINKIMGPDETIAMYEIELQYYVNRKMICIDSVAGDPLFRKHSFKHLMENGLINYLGIDQHIGAVYNASSIWGKLFIEGKTLKIGESVVHDGIRYTKILEDDGLYRYRMWKYIYKIEKVKFTPI